MLLKLNVYLLEPWGHIVATSWDRNSYPWHVQKGLYPPILYRERNWQGEMNGKGESAGQNLLDLDAMWDQDKARSML